jgi:hypothetical protein
MFHDGMSRPACGQISSHQAGRMRTLQRGEPPGAGWLVRVAQIYPQSSSALYNSEAPRPLSQERRATNSSGEKHRNDPRKMV